MHEAVNWEHAAITGNGRQGALCWGDPAAIRVTVSHERLFLPLNPPLDAPDTAAILPRLRDLLDHGHYAAAAEAVCEQAVAGEPAYAETVWTDPLVGAATLTVRPHRPGPVTDFRRSVDLSSGLVVQEWRDGGGEVRIEIFASRPENAIMIRLTATGGFTGSLDLALIDGTPPRPVTAHLDGLEPAAGSGAHVDGPNRAGGNAAHPGDLTLTAGFDADWPGALTGYRVRCHVLSGVVEGGEVRSDAVLAVRTLLPDEPDPTARPADDETPPAMRPATGEPAHAVPEDFAGLLAAHREVHGELFGWVALDLGGEPAADDELFAGAVGPALVQRLFDAGRYAIISSTGELPPTLQGVWSGTWTPPWSSGYTLDGNLPAAVAALLPTGTPELLVPVFDLLDSVRDDLRHNARRLYRARGLLTPAHLSTHGRQNHFGPVWCLTFWTAGAGWLGRLYFDHWRYTGDRDFLRDRALPFMREAADFYLDFVRIRHGRAVFSPSYSPENAPANTGSQACVDATMDVAVVRDLLTNLLLGSAELGLDEPDAPRWRKLLDALPGYRVADGMLAEWCHPGLDDQPAHRHASQLWPLWYEPDPLITADPGLRTAARATVRSKLAWWAGEDADEMAFGLVQLGLAAAALGMAEEAYRTVEWMASRYWRPNLVPTHNRDAIFNVDIAGGFPAVVAAMLVRSAHGRLDLLPALPAAWPRGRVTGLAARDAVRIAELRWEPGHVEAVLVARRDTRLVVGAPPGPTPTRTLLLPAGEPVAVRFGP